jgi:8-oxo-dGTP diphosphatase
MTHINVACAIIEYKGKVLAVQRSEVMSLPLKWEFPGGKIKSGESPEEGLRRELLEELEMEVGVCRPLPQATHRYPDFSVTLFPFICASSSDSVTLHEHKAATWLPPEQLHTIDWAEADFPVIGKYLETLQSLSG